MRTFSGYVDSLDANEAEVFAPLFEYCDFLFGYCELGSLGGYNAIEGDSFSALR